MPTGALDVTTVAWQPGEGEHVTWSRDGHQFLMKVLPEHSGGSFSLTEAVIPAGKGAGLHIHDAAEECWYVLDGDYRFTIGGKEIAAGPGSVVLVPRGTPHGLVVGEKGGRHLTIFAPAGCELAFREIGAAMDREDTSPEFWSGLGARTATRFNVQTAD
jgi:quercetin dioxygenase-like cupin family protein